MTDAELTKNAKKLLNAIYKTYKKRIKDGDTIERACQFKIGELQAIAKQLGWKNEDAFTVENELGKAGLINPFSLYTFDLNTNGIAYMENRWKRQIKNTIEWIVSLLK